MLFPGRRTEVGAAGASSSPVSLVVLQIYQNNIRPDLPDFAPGNLAFAVLAEDSPDFFTGGSDDSQDAAVFRVKNQIAYMTHPPAVADIDYVLFTKFTESHKDLPMSFYILCRDTLEKKYKEERPEKYRDFRKRNLYTETFEKEI